VAWPPRWGWFGSGDKVDPEWLDLSGFLVEFAEDVSVATAQLKNFAGFLRAEYF
jgi:hypothetical protein